MNRIIIPGPPGTGKTHHLINNYLNKELNEYKTSADRIAYLTLRLDIRYIKIDI